MARADFEEIVENFELFDDWEDRYRYVIDLGRDMEPLPDALKTPATKVEGCASQVWLVPEIRGEGAGAELHFTGDSDAMIVRGLIAVLKALVSGAAVSEVPRIDMLGEFRRLGLDQHLSAQRSNGLRAMMGRLQEIATERA